MLAARITGPAQISIDEIDRPVLQEPGDAILMVTTSAISSWDVTAFLRGDTGVIPGAHLTGIVVEIGSDVQSVDIDDLVIRRVGPAENGAERPEFGGHAEYVRVVNADNSLVRTTAAAEERTVLAGGSIATGIAAAERILELHDTGALLVWGCDAGALSALAWLKRKAPESLRRAAFDHIAGRSTLARTYGAERVSLEDAQELNPGIVLIGSPPKGPSVEELASFIASGTHVISLDPASPPEDVFSNGVSGSVCDWASLDQIKRASLAIQLRQIDLTPVVSHVMPLDEADDAYARAADVTPGTQTVLLKP